MDITQIQKVKQIISTLENYYHSDGFLSKHINDDTLKVIDILGDLEDYLKLLCDNVFLANDFALHMTLIDAIIEACSDLNFNKKND